MQTIVAGISKAVLPTEPQAKTKLPYGGREYKVSRVGGHQATDADWELHCIRFHV